MNSKVMYDLENENNVIVDTYKKFINATCNNMKVLANQRFIPSRFINTTLIDGFKLPQYSSTEDASADTYNELVNVLKRDLTGMIVDLRNAKSDISDHETKITELDERLTDDTVKDDVSSVKSDLTKVRSSVDDHETRITSLEEAESNQLWRINTEVIRANSTTITPVSELWINPNNLLWDMMEVSYSVSDVFKWKDEGGSVHDSVYVTLLTLPHKSKDIRGFLDAIGYKGLRVRFQWQVSVLDFTWSLNDNNTMNISIIRLDGEKYGINHVDEHIQILPPFYNGNRTCGIGFIIAGRETDSYTREEFIDNLVVKMFNTPNHWTVSIAGIAEGSDENEPFTDYTPEVTETTISSAYPIKNSYPIEGPNMLSLTDYKYDQTEVHLDNIVESKGTDYIRLWFDNINKDVLADCSYTGVIMTYYLPPTKFVSSAGIGIDKMCIYRIRTSANTYTYKTDALILQNGAWTLNLVDIDDVMFLFDLALSDDYSPRNMYQLGLSRIVIEIKPQTLYTDKTIICDEIIANNCFQYQPSLIPNFSRPKVIGEEVVSLSSIVEDSYSEYPTDSKTMWYIDFGYEPDSEEFSQLGLGQEFRFTDEVAGYEFRAKVVEDPATLVRYWQFDNGTVPYSVPLKMSYNNICNDNDYTERDRFFVFKLKWNFDNAASIYRSYIQTDATLQYLTTTI